MSEKVFYSPILTKRDLCSNCKVCVEICSVKALEKTILDIEVDRKKCAEYVIPRDECIACTAICPQGIIKLVPFVIQEDGEIKQLESA